MGTKWGKELGCTAWRDGVRSVGRIWGELLGEKLGCLMIVFKRVSDV